MIVAKGSIITIMPHVRNDEIQSRENTEQNVIDIGKEKSLSEEDMQLVIIDIDQHVNNNKFHYRLWQDTCTYVI